MTFRPSVRASCAWRSWPCSPWKSSAGISPPYCQSSSCHGAPSTSPILKVQIYQWLHILLYTIISKCIMNFLVDAQMFQLQWKRTVKTSEKVFFPFQVDGTVMRLDIWLRQTILTQIKDHFFVYKSCLKHAKNKLFDNLATLTGYSGCPAIDCL